MKTHYIQVSTSGGVTGTRTLLMRDMNGVAIFTEQEAKAKAKELNDAHVKHRSACEQYFLKVGREPKYPMAVIVYKPIPIHVSSKS